jgi:hypothetical protein
MVGEGRKGEGEKVQLGEDVGVRGNHPLGKCEGERELPLQNLPYLPQHPRKILKHLSIGKSQDRNPL